MNFVRTALLGATAAVLATGTQGCRESARLPLSAGIGPHPELRTYRCPRCSHVDTIEDAADKGR